MDGYIRANTDDKGKIIDIWDEWYRNSDLRDYMSDCGVVCYFQDYTFSPNSLILITFNYKTEITESYMYGRDVEEWLEIKNEIVLIENYNHEDLYGDKCDYCGCYTEFYKEEEKGKCCPKCFSELVGLTEEEVYRNIN